jgi:hypothetical protein
VPGRRYYRGMKVRYRGMKVRPARARRRPADRRHVGAESWCAAYDGIIPGQILAARTDPAAVAREGAWRSRQPAAGLLVVESHGSARSAGWVRRGRAAARRRRTAGRGAWRGRACRSQGGAVRDLRRAGTLVDRRRASADGSGWTGPGRPVMPI